MMSKGAPHLSNSATLIYNPVSLSAWLFGHWPLNPVLSVLSTSLSILLPCQGWVCKSCWILYMVLTPSPWFSGVRAEKKSWTSVTYNISTLCTSEVSLVQTLRVFFKYNSPVTVTVFQLRNRDNRNTPVWHVVSSLLMITLCVNVCLR